MSWLDGVPLLVIVMICLTLGLAPFFPEPHLFEKIRMLTQGHLTKPIDMFDLAMHGAPWVVLVLKIGRMAVTRSV